VANPSTDERSRVQFERAFADGQMLFSRDGTYFTLTAQDIQNLLLMAEAVKAVQAAPEQPCGCPTNIAGGALCEERTGFPGSYCLHERQLEERSRE
jgi:hypothetical protein